MDPESREPSESVPRAAPPVVDPIDSEGIEAQSDGTVARFKAAKDAVTERAGATRDRLEATRSQSQTLDTFMTALEEDTRTGGGVLAAAVGFRVFLFMVPYVFTLVVGFGIASDAGDADPKDLAKTAGIGGLAAKAIASSADTSLSNRLTSIMIGGFALFLAARGVVKVLRIVHSLMWDVPMPKLKKPSRAALFFIGIVSIAMLIASFVGWLRNETVVGGIFGLVLYMLVPIGAWLYISWLMPHEECEWTTMVPGALLFGVGIEALHIVTVTWIAHSLSHKSDTYGAIGGSLALLLWAYLLGRLITASTALNVAWYRKHQPPSGVDQLA